MYDRYNDIDKFITDPDKFRVLLPNKNIGNLVEQKESGDPIRRML